MTAEAIPALVGNARIRAQLAGGRFGHAYILSGPKGSGRHTLADWLCQAMLCTAPAARPCGQCRHCRKVAAHIHPDVIRASDLAEKTGRLSVAEARTLHADAFVSPNEGARKIYLFDLEEISAPVQNVLLKLIEEGPPYAAFLLLVEHTGQLLPTVRSRCEELQLTPVSVKEALPFLQGRCPSHSAQALRRAAEESGGILGVALHLLEENTPEDTSLAEQFCHALAHRDEAALAQFLAGNEKRSRDELVALMHQCRVLLHQGLLLAVGTAPRTSAEVGKALSALPKSTLLQLDALCTQTITRLEANAGTGILLAWLVVSCMEVL